MFFFQAEDGIRDSSVTGVQSVLFRSARGSSCEKSIYRYQARLWIFGDAVGAACWRKGYDACKQQMTARDDRIRVDFAIGELLHLTALAHLGFKKMMPNDRGIEMHRFGGEQHAREVARALEKLE